MNFFSIRDSGCQHSADSSGVDFVYSDFTKRAIPVITSLRPSLYPSQFGDFSPSTMSLCSSISKRSNSGRTPGNIAYHVVTYNSNKYVIATITHKKTDIQFIFDHADYNLVSERAWHLSSGKYIGTNIFSQDETIKEIYLHNYLMKGVTLIDEDEKEYVVHINKNPFDNRRANLRLINAKDHTLLKSKKKRIITLPEDSGLKSDDIPKHISYVKASGNHGDRFSVELPTEGIYWKTSSSKKLTLREKLEEAKKKLDELYVIYPHLNPNVDQDLSQRLAEEFKSILNLDVTTSSSITNS